VMADGSRVAKMFEGLRGERAALIAYATGYYPDEGRCREVITTMLDAGADAIEIGIPFSDPVMDGPVIQEASSRGLRAGATPSGVLDMVSGLREQTERPLLLMTYYNPVFKFGLEKFVRRASTCGVDGIVVPDLPAEEMGPFKAACDAAGVATIAFSSMTTTPARIREAAAMTTGFLYCVSLLGPTGARASVSSELPAFLERVRENASCPLAAGLGVSTPEQCARIGEMVEGVIVGSALMREVATSNGDLTGLRALVRSMSQALVVRAVS
jgi:tryptophan synthase alpha chain